MSDVTSRILHAVKGDHAAIQALAGAIARNDGKAVHEILAARGVALEASELGDVMSQAASAASSGTCTCT
jgi:hypothetical protein